MTDLSAVDKRNYPMPLLPLYTAVKSVFHKEECQGKKKWLAAPDPLIVMLKLLVGTRNVIV